MHAQVLALYTVHVYSACMRRCWGQLKRSYTSTTFAIIYIICVDSHTDLCVVYCLVFIRLQSRVSRLRLQSRVYHLSDCSLVFISSPLVSCLSFVRLQSRVYLVSACSLVFISSPLEVSCLSRLR